MSLRLEHVRPWAGFVAFIIVALLLTNVINTTLAVVIGATIGVCVSRYLARTKPSELKP